MRNLADAGFLDFGNGHQELRYSPEFLFLLWVRGVIVKPKP